MIRVSIKEKIRRFKDEIMLTQEAFARIGLLKIL